MPSARHLDAVLGQCVKHDVIHETGSKLAYGIFVREDGTATTENVPRIIQRRSDVFFGMREYKKINICPHFHLTVRTRFTEEEITLSVHPSLSVCVRHKQLGEIATSMSMSTVH